jgi:quercetin dioxygenase-like cupin family protein
MTPDRPGGTTRFDPAAEPALRPGTACRVPGLGRVEIIVGAADTGGVFDLTEVLIEPGVTWAAHRHAFTEWFRVLEGELEFLAPDGGRLRSLAGAGRGQTCVVPPWAPHAVRNTAESPARVLVSGQPGVMSRYFALSGARAGDPAAPSSPRALAELAARYDIELITTTG